MEKVLIIFSTLTHNHDFMYLFWLFATFPVGLFHVFYFRSESKLTEKELEEISPDFKHINTDYGVFGIIALTFLIIFPLLILAPGWDQWALQKYGIKFYPSSAFFMAGFGIHQGLFALRKGVYLMGRFLTYIYGETAKIRRIALFQIAISISAVILAILFFFATV